MKNKILLFIFGFMVSILLLVDNVNAFNCNYYKEGNTGDTPDLVIENISGYTTYDFKPYLSPFIRDKSDNIYDNCDRQGFYLSCTQTGTKDILWTFDGSTNRMLTFLSLYPNRRVYENYLSKPDDGDKCPKLLLYEKYVSTGKLTYILIHTDDLDVDPSKPIKIEAQEGPWEDVQKTVIDFWNEITSGKYSNENGYLISEKYKGTSVDELVGEYNCITYSSYISLLEESAKNNGCDNNQEFNRMYQEIKELCDYFRETQNYAETGSSRAKQCSKACSNFKDDISDMCKLSSTSGCNSLGPKVVKWIYKVIKWARYIVPVIIIILVILEYIKALASEDEKAMKDATNHMFMRLMIAALIFILPFILDFVLNIFNITELDVNNLFCQK